MKFELNVDIPEVEVVPIKYRVSCGEAYVDLQWDHDDQDDIPLFLPTFDFREQYIDNDKYRRGTPVPLEDLIEVASKWVQDGETNRQIKREALKIKL